MGRPAEAMTEIQRAQALEPLSVITHRDVAWHLFFQRRYDEAIAHLEETLQLDANYAGARTLLARALAEKGRYAEALEHLRLAAPFMPPGINLSFVAHVQAMSGDRRAADASMAQIEADSADWYVPPYYAALVYTAEGRAEPGPERARSRVSRTGLDARESSSGSALRSHSRRASIHRARRPHAVPGSVIFA